MAKSTEATAETTVQPEGEQPQPTKPKHENKRKEGFVPTLLRVGVPRLRALQLEKDLPEPVRKRITEMDGQPGCVRGIQEAIREALEAVKAS